MLVSKGAIEKCLALFSTGLAKKTKSGDAEHRSRVEAARPEWLARQASLKTPAHASPRVA